MAVPPLLAGVAASSPYEWPWGFGAAGGVRGSFYPPCPRSLQGEEEEEAELGT